MPVMLLVMVVQMEHGDAVKQSDESQGGAVLSPPHRCEDGLIILTAALVFSHAAVLQCCTPAPSR